MRRGTKLTLVIAWIIVATLCLAHIWVMNPGFYPHLPDSFIAWADSMYRPQNAEEIADLASIIGIGIWFVIVSALTLLIVLVWRFALRRINAVRLSK